MNNFNLAKSRNFLLKESVELDEMAKIQGDLKSTIERIVAENPEVEGLALKKIIRADQDVIDALDGDDLYDNQLNKFIKLLRGERTLQQRGRKPSNNDSESLGEGKESGSITLWFREGKRALAELEKAKSILTQNNIEFTQIADYSLDLTTSNTDQIRDILSSQGVTKYVFMTQVNEGGDLNEMAKIAGDLKNAILSVIKQNPDLNGLPLKKAIKGDQSVIDALDGDTLYDNQLNKFIALAKGERTLNQTNAVNNDITGAVNKTDGEEDELDVFKAPTLPKTTNTKDFMGGDEEDNTEIDTTVKSDTPDDDDSVSKANMYKNIITKKVNKIEALPSNERANSVDMKALKQYIANPQISKLLGKETIQSLVSSIIG